MIKIKMKDTEDTYEPRTKLTVLHRSESQGGDGRFKEVLSKMDGGEPEDNSFGRDWNWVPDALEQMYQLGRADGALITTQEIAQMIKGGGL